MAIDAIVAASTTSMTSMTSTYSDCAGPISSVAMSGDDQSTDGVASLPCAVTVVVVVVVVVVTDPTGNELSAKHDSSQSTDGVSSLSCTVGVVQMAGGVKVVVVQ
jgi:hypothetical protein